MNKCNRYFNHAPHKPDRLARFVMAGRDLDRNARETATKIVEEGRGGLHASRSKVMARVAYDRAAAGAQFFDETPERWRAIANEIRAEVDVNRRPLPSLRLFHALTRASSTTNVVRKLEEDVNLYPPVG